jgi:hypothetical protein
LDSHNNKNRCIVDSFSLQNRRVLSSTLFLLARLSLVSTLLLANNHKNTCNLDGTGIFHIIGVNTCLTPLLLIIAYKVCTEYFPEGWYCQTMASSSSENYIVLAICKISYHCSIVAESTVLLKVNFKLTPSQTSYTIFPCSKIIEYTSQY